MNGEEMNDGGGPFIPVERKKKRMQKNPAPVFGKKTPTTGQSIAGQRNPQTQSFFVGGISNNTSEETLRQYIWEEMNVEPIVVAINKINNFNRSFKVTVNAANKDKLVDPASWETNIIIKEYREKRKQSRDSINSLLPPAQNHGPFVSPGSPLVTLPANLSSNYWNAQYAINNGLNVF